MNSALQYHRITSYERHHMEGHFLDWKNQPKVFKTYEGLPQVQMPRDASFEEKDFFGFYASPALKKPHRKIHDVEALSRILRLTCTLTAQARQTDGMFYFRSAASAGALYPTEIYAVSEGLEGLDAGLYHFSIGDHSLVKLRKGRFSGWIDTHVTSDGKGPSPLIFCFTAIFFRSAWKYRKRAYRYHLLDTGHALENLSLALLFEGYRFDISFDFEDVALNRFLGLDEDCEVALALCRVGGPEEVVKTHPVPDVEALPASIKTASRVSPDEFKVPEIKAVHHAGYAQKHDAGTKPDMQKALGLRSGTPFKIPQEIVTQKTLPYPRNLFERRSSRNFVGNSFGSGDFHAVLRVLNDSLGPYSNTVCTGFLASGVASVADGFYLLGEEGFGLVKAGRFTSEMAHICLDQGWMAGAELHVVFMSHLEMLQTTWGARGYRYAMLKAGCLGERLYLAASALGLGCCGIGAFYDREAAALLGLNDASRVLYVVAVGSVKKKLNRNFNG